MILILSVIAASGAFLFLGTYRWSHPDRVARALLWIGAAAPWLVVTPKSAADAASVGPVELARGLTPIACLALAMMIAHFPRRQFGWVEASLTMYLAICMASAIWSVNPTATLLKAAVLASTYLCLWMLSRLYKTPREALDAAAGIAILITFSAVAGILANPGSAFRSDSPDGSVGWRLGVIIPRVDANILGWVAGAAFLAILLRVGPHWTRGGKAHAAMLLLSGVECVAARSRFALLSWVIVLVAVLLLRSGRRATAGLVAGFTAALLGVWVSYNPAPMQAFLIRGQTEHGLTTLTGRTDVWGAAVQLWETQPWLGFGYYSGHRFLLPTFNLGREYANIDSTWLETLLDVGVFGVAALALFVFLGIVRACRTRAVDGDYKLFAGGVASAIMFVAFINPTVQMNLASGLIATAVIMAIPPGTKRAGLPSQDASEVEKAGQTVHHAVKSV